MSIAPPPAAIPLTAAMIGFRSWRMFHDIAGHARKFIKLVAFHLQQSSDDLIDAAAGTKPLLVPVKTTTLASPS